MSASSLKIQTTFRLHGILTHCPPIQISFCSAVGTWVCFTLDGTSGILYDIEGLSPKTVIPNWYTNAPFTAWRISIASMSASGYIELEQSTIVEDEWSTDLPDISVVCTQLTPQTVCALWTGKFGYTILS